MSWAEQVIVISKRVARISFKNVLCATDFSPSSSTAVAYAVAIARRYRSKLYVAHVIPPDIYKSVPPEAMPEAVKQTHVQAQQDLECLSHRDEMEHINHELLLRDGQVSTVLLELLDKYKIDLLVIGTRGHTGLDRLLLGSVAEEMFRQAKCPVLIVPSHASQDSAARIGIIVYPTDFSQISLAAAPYAFSLAKRYRAQLILLNVVQNPTAQSTEDFARLRKPIETQLHELLPADYRPNREPQVEVEFGPPAEGIARAASQANAGLIILGMTPAKAAVAHLPEGIIYKVVRTAACPVLTIRGVSHGP